MFALAACSLGGPSAPELPPPPDAKSAPAPESLTTPEWHVALIAGVEPLDTASNMLAPLGDLLKQAGIAAERIQPFTGLHGGERHGTRSDTPRAPPSDDIVAPSVQGPPRQAGDPLSASSNSILRRLLRLAREPTHSTANAACLVYLGGTFDGGTVTLAEGKLDVEDLDRALGGGCGSAPTVVIASGCHSGVLTEAPFARSNRIVIAASGKDDAGFGCGPNLGLTTFEECFLGALPDATLWTDVAARTQGCVRKREELVGQPALPVVSFIGSNVAALPAPAGQIELTRDVSFRPGIGRFLPDDAPYYSVLKARTRAAFEAYRRAPKPKAMALTLAGTVTIVSAGMGETQDDVARLALERCEYLSSGACELYARDDIVAAADANGRVALQPRGIRERGRFDPALVPFIRDDQRRALTAYATLPDPKALALGPMGEAFAIGTGVSQEAADAVALGRCRSETRSDCILYARGLERVGF